MRFALIGLAFASMFVIGCSAKVDPPPTPLTLAEWKELPVDKKYEAESFERLKAGEAALADEKEWNKFFRTVVVPMRRKEQPVAANTAR